MEWLRYVARSGEPDPTALAVEAADALCELAENPPAMLAAAKCLLAANPGSGPLWWIAAHLVTAVDPHTEAPRLVEVLLADHTVEAARDEPGALAGLWLQASAVGPDGFVVGNRSAKFRAKLQKELATPEMPVTVVVGRGCCLPKGLWGALKLCVENSSGAWKQTTHILSYSAANLFVAETGVGIPKEVWLRSVAGCPDPPELSRIRPRQPTAVVRLV